MWAAKAALLWSLLTSEGKWAQSRAFHRLQSSQHCFALYLTMHKAVLQITEGSGRVSLYFSEFPFLGYTQIYLSGCLKSCLKLLQNSQGNWPLQHPCGWHNFYGNRLKTHVNGVSGALWLPDHSSQWKHWPRTHKSSVPHIWFFFRTILHLFPFPATALESGVWRYQWRFILLFSLEGLGRKINSILSALIWQFSSPLHPQRVKEV